MPLRRTSETDQLPAMPRSTALTVTPPAPAATQGRRDSTLLNRNIWVGRRRTSLRLEPAMWQALEEVAAGSGLTIHELCTLIDSRRRESSLTASVRVFLLCYYRDAMLQGGQPSGRSLVDRALRDQA
jgi:predicted DNA-binding ribbon-helix-helix protein